MQGFINKEYYIYCKTREEVLAFYNLCQSHGLRFTTRWRAEQEVVDYIVNATFVYDFDMANPNDGVSFWTHVPDGDGCRPTVEFNQIAISDINVSDILNFL